MHGIIASFSGRL